MAQSESQQNRKASREEGTSTDTEGAEYTNSEVKASGRVLETRAVCATCSSLPEGFFKYKGPFCPRL